MPSTYAHRRFGANVLDHLPAPLREKLEAHRELYDIGLHGPDLLFYYHAEKSTPVAALGNAMHDEPGRTFFDRARRVVHEEADREAALALCAILRWTAPATPLWSSSPGRAV